MSSPLRAAWRAMIVALALTLGDSWLRVVADGASEAGVAEGQSLAAELRATAPPAAFTNQLTLQVRGADGRRWSRPVTVSTILGKDGWQVRYWAPATGEAPAESLRITHHPNRAPEFYGSRGDPGGLRALTGEEIAAPFAGSDFSPQDLGLAFYHWPQQRVIRRERPEMRKGRACRLLESADPAGQGYTRVRSWIDLEHGQPIMAEAYDRHSRLVKTFSVGSVEKVDGVWRLKDLEMTDEARSSKTRLEFVYEARR